MNKTPLASTSKEANQYGYRSYGGTSCDNTRNVMPDNINRKLTKMPISPTMED
jgi:hypothetical protein